jgi:hypothetical protein
MTKNANWKRGSVKGTISFAIMSGTRRIAAGYPNDLPNRASTGILKKPTVIDRPWETGRSATCKIKEKI